MRLLRPIGLLLLLACAPQLATAQTLDTLELKKAEEGGQEDWGFGFLGIFETVTGVNADRPEVSSLVWFAPQLKLQQIYRLQLNMGFMWYYLDRSPNPWDLTDWSIQLSDLRIYKEEWSEITLSGNLRYYIPMSVSSRNADSQGALRLLLKLSRSVWDLDIGLELMGTYRFAKYTTNDPNRWQDADKMDSNGQGGFGERLNISYSPIDMLSVSLTFGLYQTRNYSSGGSYDGVGSTYISGHERESDSWDHSWELGLDSTVHIWEVFYVSLGYVVSQPVLQGDSRGTHYDPFDPKYGSLYLDLMAIY